MMAPLTWSSTTATARRYCTTRAARSCCRVANPTSREGAPSHGTGPTGLPAVCLCPADYLGGDRRAAHRATGLPGPASVLRKGAIPMPQTHHETHVTKNEFCQPSTGQEESPARLPGAIIPTALVGPAQQGREPCPIILPRSAMGVSVAPNVPAPPAAAPLALEQRATLVLTPVTNEETGEKPGAHEQHPQEEEGVEELLAPPPKASPGQEHRYPVITTPIPTPGDLHHTTPFPSSPVGHQTPWSPRHQRLFLAGLAGGRLPYIPALVVVARFFSPRAA